MDLFSRLLQKWDPIYYGGNGACPIGRCQGNLTCHNATGLCVEQDWISTTTTTTPTTTTTKGCYKRKTSWLATLFNFLDNC
ncbi:hypothetical protein Y032_0119g844 [Ancylostoma ceylanicum]|uniref:Uncharacterized protein n=1 Tax=Ancylostoma ceylanicum TaxID=53326 RepID=A0A016TBB1_9BILA|nr:hypothetical protein Y032_0119g844 [Ancylostoma ceylanicum]